MHGGRHHQPELLQIDRLGQVIEGAAAQRLDSVFGGTVGRHDHAAFAPLLVAQVLQQFHAKAVGQAHVADHHVKAQGLQLLAGLLQGGGGFYAVALAQQGQLVEGAQVGLIVNNQDGGGRGIHGKVAR